MPIALDPAQTVSFSLAVDRQLPDDVRPAFLLRYLSCRQVLAFEQLITEATEPKTAQVVSNIALNKALRILVSGWRHIKTPSGIEIAFPAGDAELAILDDLLTPSEKWELVIEGLRAIRLAESDKKKSSSQPATVTAASAPPAVAEPAETSPQS